MEKGLLVIVFTAVSIGFMHTILGPDHYVPFIAMAKARNWPMLRTAVVTLFCGAGHILSSIVIALVGILFGISVMKIEALEAFRGNLAAWALIGFGSMYFVWGMRKALKGKPHRHCHVHSDLVPHSHDHFHGGSHAHVHDEADKGNITPWVMFVIFVLGPCEPLIPIIMYPAAKNSLSGVVIATLSFGAVTVITMLGIVTAGSWGVSFTSIGKLERYTHALSGAAICASGVAIKFFAL